jgi:hypothetical protein
MLRQTTQILSDLIAFPTVSADSNLKMIALSAALALSIRLIKPMNSWQSIS